MTEKRLKNTIFLMYLVTEVYRREKNLSIEDFILLDKKYDILRYVAECPEVFDYLPASEMVREVDEYIHTS